MNLPNNSTEANQKYSGPRTFQPCTSAVSNCEQSWFSLKTESLATVQIYEHSIEVKFERPLSPPVPRSRGNRDKIREFSRSSRRWLFKTLSRVQFKQLQSAFFVTLTYHNDFPTKSETYKYHVKQFLARQKRRYPQLRYFWKLEFQKRGAPHFHLMYFYPKFEDALPLKELKLTLELDWRDFRHCCCRDCLLHSIRIEPITSYRKAVNYVGKYMAKNSGNIPEEFPGRFWGRSSDLPMKPVTTLRLNQSEYFSLKELALRILKSKGSKTENFQDKIRKNMSFWLMLDDDEIEISMFQIWKIIGEPYEYIPILVSAPDI